MKIVAYHIAPIYKFKCNQKMLNQFPSVFQMKIIKNGELSMAMATCNVKKLLYFLSERRQRLKTKTPVYNKICLNSVALNCIYYLRDLGFL